MKVKLLDEPMVEFGKKFMCDDPKMGLTIGGFYSSTGNTHRSQIHYAVIGTKENTEDLSIWINDLAEEIKAEPVDFSVTNVINNFEIENGIINIQDEEDLLLKSLFEEDDQQDDENFSYEINKRVNPDFPGFTSESAFQCQFFNDVSNNRIIKNAEIEAFLKKGKQNEGEDKETSQLEKAVAYCELLVMQFKDILENFITARPNICFIVIPDKIVKAIGSFSIGNKFFNLRRFIKAQLIALPNAIPVQLIIESTLTRTGKRRLQDKSMVAWNFINACYYKNEGTPWSLDIKDKNTCFIGISFNKVINSEDNNVRASIAQAFNYQGKGLVFIGKQFEWDPLKNQTPAPHLTYEYADELITLVLKEYERFNKIKPTRVVIHKTTDFWTGSIHSDFAETEGLKKGITDCLGNDIEMDFVTVKSSKLKLLRHDGDYPVIRGTFLEIDRNYGVLYTTGYIPYYETYPGMHVPHPLDILKFEGDTSITTLSEEILALTKLNFNNCNYYDSLPITIRFAQKVGEIIQYFDDNVTSPPNKYFFYM